MLHRARVLGLVVGSGLVLLTGLDVSGCGGSDTHSPSGSGGSSSGAHSGGGGATSSGGAGATGGSSATGGGGGTSATGGSAGTSTGGAGGSSGTSGGGGSSGQGGGGGGAQAAVCTVQVSAGQEHVCAFELDGALVCWGSNMYGQLGIGTMGLGGCYGGIDCKPTPQPVLNLGSGVVQVVSAFSHTCARKADGTVWCWGRNSSGELGDGTMGGTSCYGNGEFCKSTPQQVTALGSSVIEISGGFSHTCALKSDKTVWCWGGRLIGAATPAQVTGLGAARHITSGDDHDCAILTDHTIWCWGDNSQGQLGNGTTGGPTAPGQVIVLDNLIKHVDAGRTHVCAVKTDGSLWCWGSNGSGELGNGTTSTGIPIPAQTLGIGLNVDTVDGGYSNTCVRKTDGTAWCWGEGSEGQLGVGPSSSSSPVNVSSLGTDVFAISPGGHHTCAIKALEGTVFCWGANTQGEIGNNQITSPQLCQQIPSMCTYTPTATLLPCP